MSNPKGNPASLTAPRYKPSETGNPGGKPKGARNRLQGAFVEALANDFDEHGKRAIVDCRKRDPARYLGIVAALMPKQIEQAQPFDDLTDAELTAGIALLRSRLSQSAGAGIESPDELTSIN